MIPKKGDKIFELLNTYKPSILFLLRFLGVYVLGNVFYGLWVVSYGNLADPITSMVATHSAFLLQLVGINALAEPSILLPNVAIMLEDKVVVNVYEGCNAINVSILFVAFIIAYRGKAAKVIKFSVLGLFAIYIFNLFRVAGLFLIAKYFPDHLYLMHKFIFTGVIYVFVFLLWFIWVRSISKNDE